MIFPVNTALLFSDVEIPQGAIVHKAFIRFTYNYNGGLGNTNDLVISALKNDNVNSLPVYVTSHSTTNGGVQAELSRTDSGVSWTIDEAGLSENDTFDTPDISCVIQELVSLDDWRSGNNMALFVENLDMVATEALFLCHTPAELHVWMQPCIHESGGGGIKVGGTTTTAINYSETANGGVKIGGQTVIYQRFAEEASGGVVVGGETRLAYVLKPSGGVVVGGAVVTRVRLVVIPSGGVVIGHPSFCGYTNRISIVVPMGAVASDLTKVVARFKLTLPAGTAESFLFVDADNNIRGHYVLDYDSTTGGLDIAAKVDLLAEEDNVFYLLFGVDEA